MEARITVAFPCLGRWRATILDALGVKTRKILQQNFDQDAVGDLVWCGNMNWKNIAVYIPHRLTRQGNWTLKSALYSIPCLRIEEDNW